MSDEFMLVGEEYLSEEVWSFTVITRGTKEHCKDIRNQVGDEYRNMRIITKALDSEQGEQ